MVSGEKSVVNLIKDPLYVQVGPFWCFQDSQSLVFDGLIMMCLSMRFFEFILLGIC